MWSWRCVQVFGWLAVPAPPYIIRYFILQGKQVRFRCNIAWNIVLITFNVNVRIELQLFACNWMMKAISFLMSPRSHLGFTGINYPDVLIIQCKLKLCILILNNIDRPPDTSASWKSVFFISHPKHMLWVLKRTVSMRRFF